MIELLTVIWRWKRSILLACLVAAIGSIVVSLFMDDYYESTSTMFATNPYRMDRQYLFSKEPGKNPVYDLGGSAEIDRFISMCNSKPLQDFIVEKFDLYNHYEIEADDKLRSHKVFQTLSGNYNVIKNALDAIEITVKDKDPQVASEMVNSIVEKADELNLAIKNKVSTNIIDIFTDLKIEKEEEFQLLSDSLDRLRINGKTNQAALLIGMLENKTEELTEINDLYGQYKSSSKRSFSSVYILEQAFPSIKKAGPKRSLIVIGTVLATLFIATLTAIFIEQLKQNDFSS